jgi:guanylate cyclase
MDAPTRFFQTWLDRAARIGADPRDDDARRLRKGLLVLVSILILPISLTWGAIYLALGAQAGLIAWLYFLVSAGALAVFSRTHDTEWLLRVELLAILLAPTISMAFVGGFVASGGVGVWGILAPLGALVFIGARSGVRWFLAFITVFLVSGVVGELSSGGRSALPAWFESLMIALNVTVAGAVVFGLLATFVRQREDALAALQVEQDRAEELLLNILPRSIADRLKAETATIADQFAEATILFADIVDFTPLSDRLQPAEVVGLLDDLFTHFDLLAERHGVEKIKTIGDCYMVAAGVPSPRADHAHVIGQMAIEMRDAMRSEHGVGHLGLEIRIGINSGPVVAGIIGRKRFLYDLWGDAVNMASRMESSGTAGQIQVTQATHDLLQDAFRLEPRGTVPIKGKGEVETWYLVGRKPSSQTVDDLILDLIEWIGPGERPYAETMEAWRTSCPRLPVWEDATDRGFIERDRRPGEPAFVAVTPSGKAHLAARRGSTASA